MNAPLSRQSVGPDGRGNCNLRPRRPGGASGSPGRPSGTVVFRMPVSVGLALIISTELGCPARRLALPSGRVPAVARVLGGCDETSDLGGWSGCRGGRWGRRRGRGPDVERDTERV